MRRTAQSIEEAKEQKPAGAPTESKRGKHPNSRKNLKPPWPKGVSANPTGMPGTDLAALAARRMFERHEAESDLEGLSEELKGFNAYGFGVMADRAYGKLKEQQDINLKVDVAGLLSKIRKRVADASKP